MFSVDVTEDALVYLKAVLKKEEEYGIRIFQYATGSPCCRKVLLGATPDELDDLNDEVEKEFYGIPFIVEEEVISRYGNRFKIVICPENKIPVVETL